MYLSGIANEMVVFRGLTAIGLTRCPLHSKGAAIVVLYDLRWKVVPLSRIR
jgi:hypothetical protein